LASAFGQLEQLLVVHLLRHAIILLQNVRVLLALAMLLSRLVSIRSRSIQHVKTSAWVLLLVARHEYLIYWHCSTAVRCVETVVLLVTRRSVAPHRGQIGASVIEAVLRRLNHVLLVLGTSMVS
jgi:hypothetical protein